MISFLKSLQGIQIYIFLSLIWCVIFYSKKKVNAYLIIILFLNVICEIGSILSDNTTINHARLNLYFIFQNVFWFLISYELSYNKKRVVWVIVAYLLFCLVNLAFIETGLNYNLFIVGAFLYLALFIIESFGQLSNENLDFFQSNNYLLLFCPVMFYCGLSIIIGFKSVTVFDTPIIGNLSLYKLINKPVNIIYYTCMNLYMYKEKRKIYVNKH